MYALLVMCRESWFLLPTSLACTAELSRPLPDEFWEYGNPLRFYFEVEHGIKQLNTTKLAKVKDINQVDKAVTSLVSVLKEMTQELKYQNVPCSRGD